MKHWAQRGALTQSQQSREWELAFDLIMFACLQQLLWLHPFHPSMSEGHEQGQNTLAPLFPPHDI